MSEGLAFDVRETVLSNSTFGPSEVQQMVQAISEDFSHYNTLRDAVNELAQKPDLTPATKVRLGVCCF